MRALLAVTMAVSLGAAISAHASTLVGTWQGTAFGQQGVIKIDKGPGGALHGELFFPGREASGSARNGNPISTIQVSGRHFHFDADEMPLTVDGDLSADGNQITVISTRDGQSVPITFTRATDKTAWVIDPSSHKVLFVPVEKDVRLEVLDWGGSGPPLIFVPGNGNTGHVFDDFAPKFTGKHHVYAITRRGFGMSSKPAPTPENYDADRLGDDVLAVIDALKLVRPVVAGHSLGGEELSSIGTRHPEKVAGLIYLDAGYGYAFYNPKEENTSIDAATIRRDLTELTSATPSRRKTLIAEIQATMPTLQSGLETMRKRAETAQDRPPASRRTVFDGVEGAIFSSMRKYSGVKAPALAIFASPHACPGNCESPQVKAQEASVAAEADAFEAGTPSSHVVRLANANHYVFFSHEADVMREMNAFMDGLH
jgi:pimeloyl-ACP methyl ester carboxylesterase